MLTSYNMFIDMRMGHSALAESLFCDTPFTWKRTRSKAAPYLDDRLALPSNY